jgi:hypothetical protein
VWTADGTSWNGRYLPIPPTAPGSAATAIASTNFGTLLRETHYAFDVLANGLWFIPNADASLAREQGLNRQVVAIAAFPDRFVVLSQCDDNADCAAPTVSIGAPVYGVVSTPSTTPNVPAPSEIPVGGVREAITRQNLAAARNGMPGGLLEPGWLPNGFVLVYADYNQQSTEIDSVDLRYEADGHYIHVWQTRASPEQLGEKDPVAKGKPLRGTQWNTDTVPAEQVGRDGVVEYSTRLPDARTVSIDSDLDQDTMRHVLDSVYLHGPAESPAATPSPQPSLAPTPKPTLSRDAAIAAARAFAGVSGNTPVASAEFGPFGQFEPDANQKNSPDHLVWQVIFGSTAAPTRVVILDSSSGALIEVGAATSD